MVRTSMTGALLQAWERGLSESPLRRVLILLAVVYPQASPGQIEALPVGVRDSRLLDIREALFGSQLTCQAACPRCAEKLEVTLDISQLRAQPPAETAGEDHTLTVGGIEVRFRLPDSSDLLQLAGQKDETAARRLLFERCVTQAASDGVSLQAGDLPSEVLAAVAGRMAQLDPQADIQVALTCPACSWQWSTPFDIASYLWGEINHWAVRILREVHTLASNYGWREADILDLSPLRRQYYLDLIG